MHCNVVEKFCGGSVTNKAALPSYLDRCRPSAESFGNCFRIQERNLELDTRDKGQRACLCEISRIAEYLLLGYYTYTLTLKLLIDRSKFKIKHCFPFLSTIQNFWQMFSVAIHSHLLKGNIHKLKIPRKKPHSVKFQQSNLKVGPFGPPHSLRANFVVKF